MNTSHELTLNKNFFHRLFFLEVKKIASMFSSVDTSKKAPSDARSEPGFFVKKRHFFGFFGFLGFWPKTRKNVKNTVRGGNYPGGGAVFFKKGGTSSI